MIQQDKWRFLDAFITTTGKSVRFLLNLMVSMENEIRQSYSDSIQHNPTNHLAEMMMLDGVFLIQLFRKVGNLIPIDQDDPIFGMLWVLPLLRRDLLMLENQIPFFLLQKLFDLSTTPHTITLPCLIIQFFSEATTVDRTRRLYDNNLEGGKHLLDLFRASFIVKTHGERNPVAIVRGNEISEHEPCLKLIEPATDLALFGVLLKANDRADSFLDIKFQRGALLIPRINMDGPFASFLLNGVAFEQCCVNCSKDITTYAVFLGCLLNNPTDVDMLSQRKIINNCFGTNEELVKFFTNAGKDLDFDIINDNYLKSLFANVNEYCLNVWRVNFARITRRYFGKPNHLIIIMVTTSVAIYLAVIQTMLAVLSYYNPQRK